MEPDESNPSNPSDLDDVEKGLVDRGLPLAAMSHYTQRFDLPAGQDSYAQAHGAVQRYRDFQRETSSSDLDDTEKDLAARDAILAVKHYRERRGVGLKEAYTAVTTWQASHGLRGERKDQKRLDRARALVADAVVSLDAFENEGHDDRVHEARALAEEARALARKIAALWKKGQPPTP